MRYRHVQTLCRIALLFTLMLATACGTSREGVHLSSAAHTPTPTADTPKPASDPTQAVEPEEATTAAPPDPSPTPDAATPAPPPEAASQAELALQTRHPVDGFDLEPPDGFSPAEDYPLHGVSMVADGHEVGIRFFRKHGTGQSVLVAVWSERAEGTEERLERYQRHTGNVTSGRPVHGASAIWELRERSSAEASTATNLSVLMPDGTEIWLSGVNIPDVSLLYEFLTRIEDAPGSLSPRPDPGVAPTKGPSE